MIATAIVPEDIQEDMGRLIKKITGYDTRIADYDYDGLGLLYPRAVVSIGAVEYAEAHSRMKTREKSSDDSHRVKIMQQFTLPVIVTFVGKPGINNVKSALNKVRGKILTDYDLLFLDYASLANISVMGVEKLDSVDISVSTLIETHETLRITLSGTDVIYDEDVPIVADVDFKLNIQ